MRLNTITIRVRLVHEAQYANENLYNCYIEEGEHLGYHRQLTILSRNVTLQANKVYTVTIPDPNTCALLRSRGTYPDISVIREVG